MPRKVTREQLLTMKRMREKGMSIRGIASALGIPKSTVHYWLKKEGERVRVVRATDDTIVIALRLLSSVIDAEELVRKVKEWASA